MLYEAGEQGKLLGVADRNDRQVIWLEYNGSSQIAAIRDYTNRRVEYSYTEGRLTGVVDVTGLQTTYQYDQTGRIIKTVDAAGRTTTTAYDAYDNVAQVVDNKNQGHFFQFDYNTAQKEHYAQTVTSSGRVKEVWYDRDGDTTRVDLNGRLVQKIEKDGRNLVILNEKGTTTRQNFDEWDNLTQITYPDGSATAFEYEHKFNRPIRMTDPRGNVTAYQYDANGNLTRLDASGRVTTYTYNEFGQVLTATIENAVTTFTYDADGNVATITDPAGNVTRVLEYDAMGNPLKVEDPRGSLWAFTYDARGRLTSRTDPLGNTTTYQYDGANNLIAQTNPLQSVSYEYDDHNNLVKTTMPSGAIVTEYNADNLPVRMVDQEGKAIQAEYDNEGRLVKTIDGAGNTITYHYDASQATYASSDLPVQIDYPTYSRKLYYDKLERLIRRENADEATSYTYDAAGNVLSETDAENNNVLYEYNPFAQLRKLIAGGGTTEFSYDPRGRLVTVKDPNAGSTRYAYDQNNRLIKTIRPMGQETTYTYDAAGNRTDIVDAKGQQIHYEYDKLNRLISATYTGAGTSKTVAFTYDALGNLLAYNDGTTSATYTYDNMQHKIGETVNYGSFSLSYAYTYYANGLKKSFTGPDGITYEYAYDANNRLTSILIPGRGPLTYNAYKWNSPTQVTLPGGMKREFAYDPLMRLRAITVQDQTQTTILSRDYTYSPAGNITSKVTEHGIYSYQYDQLYRLTAATNPTLPAEAYTYDLLGNRLTTAGLNGTWNYNANNELLGYGNVTFAYDANGNLTRKAVAGLGVNYSYNVEDRLISVTDDQGTVLAEYAYDPFGRRLWKEVGGQRTYFFYTNEGLVGEYAANGQELKTYGYVPDSVWSTNPIFQKIGGSYYWYQNDHLGTPQKLTDSTGRAVWSATYNTFGNSQISLNTIENNWRFPGQYYDSETGLYYNWNRYYEPLSGRYLQQDLLKKENLYVYVSNNPVNLTDPLGLCEEKSPDVSDSFLPKLIKALGSFNPFKKKPDIILDPGEYYCDRNTETGKFSCTPFSNVPRLSKSELHIRVFPSGESIVIPENSDVVESSDGKHIAIPEGSHVIELPSGEHVVVPDIPDNYYTDAIGPQG